LKKPRFDVAKWAREEGNTEALDILHARLKRGGRIPLAEVAAEIGCSRGAVIDLCDALVEQSLNVKVHGDVIVLVRKPAPRTLENLKFISDKNGRHRFGIISDTHYGSKCAREDVATDLYDWFASEGIENVLLAGNWIDGEGHDNDHELLPDCHGLQPQVDYFVENFPEKKGITTWFVSGDDHEGWYAKREGIDVGRLLVSSAREYGRHDLRDCGYKEAFFSLEHAKTGASSKLWLDHPGGGSAHATSWTMQKIVRSLQPGEKPAIMCSGHLHKLIYFIERGVHVIGAGCTKDQDTWGRKKGLQYDVGGWIIEPRQDERGAVVEVKTALRQWFDRGYYNGAFNMAGPIRKVRAPGGRAKR